MAKKRLHQVAETVFKGDATSDHLFLIRGWLRELGFESHIYADNCHEELESEVRPVSSLTLDREHPVIYHHTIGSPVLERLHQAQQPLILIYHNITPPDFFSTTDPALARQLTWGREQLLQIQSHTVLALGDSAYNEAELRACGFARTGVLPIVLDERNYDFPLDPVLQRQYDGSTPLLLFVGRMAPNKRQEDLIKLLYFYRRIAPEAQLVLVGGLHAVEYVNWLTAFAKRLGIEEAVMFAGHVTQQEMVTYFKLADVYVSMSEHEGFGKPLIESMYLGLPVLAYAATAVPYTMGDAGVLFHQKDYEALAEMVDLLTCDANLRRQIIDNQKARVQAFLVPQVRAQWVGYLEQLGFL